MVLKSRFWGGSGVLTKEIEVWGQKGKKTPLMGKLPAWDVCHNTQDF